MKAGTTTEIHGEFACFTVRTANLLKQFFRENKLGGLSINKVKSMVLSGDICPRLLDGYGKKSHEEVLNYLSIKNCNTDNTTKITIGRYIKYLEDRGYKVTRQ